MDSLVEKLNKRCEFLIKKDCSTQTDSFIYYYPALLRYDEEIEKENPFFDGGELDSKAEFIMKHMKISGGKIQILDPDTEEHAQCQWEKCVSDNKREKNDRVIHEQTEYLREFESNINGNSLNRISSPAVFPMNISNSINHLNEDKNDTCHLSTSMCKTNNSSYSYIYDTCDRQLSNTSLTDLLVSYMASKPKNPSTPTLIVPSRHLRSCENAQLITRVSSPCLNYNFPSDQFQGFKKNEIFKSETLITTDTTNIGSGRKTSQHSIGKTNEFQKIVERERSNIISSQFYNYINPENKHSNYDVQHHIHNRQNQDYHRIINPHQSFTSSKTKYNHRVNASSHNNGYIEVFSRGRRFEGDKELQAGHFKCKTNVDETVISVSVPATFASPDKSHNLKKKSYKPIEPLLFNIASMGLNEILKSQAEHSLSKRQKRKNKN